jgi:two-component system chemotaxis response regulator CheY
MKVLVVDDSKAVRGIVKKMLKNLGHEVYEAENGEKALESLYEHNWFDLILLDWNMPGMNGYEFLKIVKKNPEWQDIKIMMVTSENQQESVLEALNAGADEYLMKPFDQEMLLTKIEMIMEDI